MILSRDVKYVLGGGCLYKPCILTVLLVLGAVAVLGTSEQAHAQTVIEVPQNWNYIPAGLDAGDPFRLLFTPSVGHSFTDQKIQKLVRDAGWTVYPGHFRVLHFGHTDRDDIRAHTFTQYPGVPVYWLGGSKIADNYDDFYAGGTPGESSQSRNERGQILHSARYSYGISPIFKIADDNTPPRIASIPSLRVGNGGFDTTITEGDTISVLLFLTLGDREGQLNYRITASGNYLSPGQTGDMQVNATGMHRFELATIDDDTAESNGTVTITLLPSTKGLPDYHLTNSKSITFTVRDNDSPPPPPSNACTKDKPCVTLGPLGSYFEGRKVTIAIHVDPPHISSSALAVKFQTKDSGHILATPDEHTHTAYVYGRTNYHQMNTVRDCNPSGQNWIEFRLVDNGNNYQIRGGDENWQRMTLTELRPHPDGPGVYIDRPTSPNELAIRENSGANIPISGLFKSGYLACSNLTINYNVAQTNNYLLTSETGNFTTAIATGQNASPAGSIPIRGPTAGNQGGGTVTITLLPGTGYKISSPSGVTYQIDDSSSGTITPFASFAEVPPPKVSIDISGHGVEGDPVSFGISADSIKPLQAPLPVNVTLSDTGNILNASDTGLRTITIPTSGSYTLQVDTINDNIVDSNNTVTLTINTGIGYTLGTYSSETLNIPDAGNGTAPQEMQMTPPPDLAFGLQQVQEPPVVAIDPALIANVTAMAAQVQHGDAHVERWNRVLAAFGEITHDNPTTAAEARTNVEKYSSPLWPQVADVLTLLEAAAAEQDGSQTPPDVPTEPDAPPAIDTELVSKVRAQAAQVHHGADHVDRWNRVLAAFGEITHDNPTTAAEARANAEKYSSPLWPQIAEVLTQLESR